MILYYITSSFSDMGPTSPSSGPRKCSIQSCKPLINLSWIRTGNLRKCKVSLWASLQIKNFIHIHYYHYFVNIFIKGLQLISIKVTLNKVITKIIFFFSFFFYFNSPVLIKIMPKIASDGKYTYKKCISRKCPNENAQNNWYLVPPSRTNF